MFSLLLLACSSSSSTASGADSGGGGGSGTNAFNGTLGGQSFTVEDGYFHPESSSTDTNGSVLYGVQILLTSYGNACNLYQASTQKMGSTDLKLKVRSYDAAVTAGTYSLSSSNPSTGTYAEAEVQVSDAMCNSTKDEATGGTVTVTTVTDTEIAGTFEVTSGSDTATGTFDVMSCTLDSDASAASTCVQ